jgi:hypothetical protein
MYVIKMMGYVESLDALCFSFSRASYGCDPPVSASYEPFILNFHMNGMEKTLASLHGMLKTAGDSNKKTPIM